MVKITGEEAQIWFEDNFRKLNRTYEKISGEKKWTFHKPLGVQHSPSSRSVCTIIFSEDRGLLFDNPFQRYSVASIDYDPKIFEEKVKLTPKPKVSDKEPTEMGATLD